MSITTIATSMAAPNSNQISFYNESSPSYSANNSNASNSPTSPRLTSATLHQLPAQCRQLRPPKSPLYVPAALRLTERPNKPSPLTPPRSAHGSLDSLHDIDSIAPITRLPTADSARIGVSKLAEDAWMKWEHLGKVTGLPTQEHWKADSAAQTCDSPTCRSSFGMFRRRHHCRHCGHIFCSTHATCEVPLDQDARFHPDGVLSRACDLCRDAYQRWEKTRAASLTRIQTIIDNQNAPNDALLDPDVRLSIALSNSDDSNDSHRSGTSSNTSNSVEPLATSQSRDWNWSTF